MTFSLGFCIIYMNREKRKYSPPETIIVMGSVSTHATAIFFIVEA